MWSLIAHVCLGTEHLDFVQEDAVLDIISYDEHSEQNHYPQSYTNAYQSDAFRNTSTRLDFVSWIMVQHHAAWLAVNEHVVISDCECICNFLIEGLSSTSLWCVLTSSISANVHWTLANLPIAASMWCPFLFGPEHLIESAGMNIKYPWFVTIRGMHFECTHHTRISINGFQCTLFITLYIWGWAWKCSDCNEARFKEIHNQSNFT